MASGISPKLKRPEPSFPIADTFPRDLKRARLIEGSISENGMTTRNLDVENNPYTQALKREQAITVNVPEQQTKPNRPCLVVTIDSTDDSDDDLSTYQDVLKKPLQSLPVKEYVDWEVNPSENLVGTEIIAVEGESSKGKGEYVGVEEDEIEFGDEYQVPDDGLGDLWNEMHVAIEDAKDTKVDASFDEEAPENDDDCLHSFILKDDIGYVCRVCGIIQKPIDQIIEYRFPKRQGIQSYQYEGCSSRKMNSDKVCDGSKFGGR